MYRRVDYMCCKVTLLVCLASLFFGCDATDPTDFESEVVVEGYLEAGRRLPDLRLMVCS